MSTSLLALLIAVIMAWLVLEQDIEPYAALWLAWAMVTLIVLATLLILAELFEDPEDVRAAWERNVGRARTSLTRAWRWIWRR
jgi:hypothetical protein